MGRTDWQQLLEFDRDHVWHPYAPLPGGEVLPVVGAEGTRLRLADGTELIDAMASWWSVIHGHRQPAILAALAEQMAVLPHVMFGGLTHEPAIRLSERLVEMTPPGLDRVFLADSGSIAVEVALKLCVQYWNGMGVPHRTRMLALRGGYHGDTTGAMALCDPEQGMHRMYNEILPRHEFMPRPPDGFAAPLDEAWAAEVEAIFDRHGEQLAGVFVEPIAQGAGGMRFHSPACLTHIRQLCDRHGIPLVADEIATGFGRTGALFACEHAGVVPDVICVGKALTGGVLSLAATLTTAEVAAAVSRSEPGALMHGPTFMGNPLACAAALASTGLLLEGDWAGDVARVETGLSAALEPARELPGVKDVRVLGAIGVIEMAEPVDMPPATAAALTEGVWLRPFGRLVYAMPPYICDEEEIATIGRAMLAATAAAG
ncbi:MAG TPA: adenosylmethionine--8-amino-7-oxononanoate transaminase [Solirubrobacterales bacterium]